MFVGGDCGCCCPPCSPAVEDVNTDEQPDVVATSDCPCEDGNTLAATITFQGHFNGVWSWVGTTDCDYSSFFDEFSQLAVDVSCDCGDWVINAATYVFDLTSVSGTTRSSTAFTLGANDSLSGTVAIDMKDLSDNVVCTITLVFG